MTYIVIKKTQCKTCGVAAKNTHTIAKDGKLVDCDGYVREEVLFSEAFKYELELQRLKDTLIDK